MRKLYLFFLMMVHSFIALSQAQVTGLNYDYARAVPSTKHLRMASVAPDTLQIPFLDDFSTSVFSPDTNLWVNRGNVYINNNYAVKPPSVNVATFDGLKNDGFPYDFPDPIVGSANTRGQTDSLISKPIDLSELAVDDDLAFSFYWQKGSFHPTISPQLQFGDTLKLFFLDSDSVWVQMWPMKEDSLLISKMSTIDSNSFEYRFIPITDTSFFHDAFQFVFTSYGNLDGNFSLWNIDYVYLDTARVTDNVQDFAFGNQLTPLLGDYSAVPYRQFEADPTRYISDEVSSGYTNLSSAANFRDFKFVTLTVESDVGETTITEVQEIADFPNGEIGAKSLEIISWNPDKQSIADSITALNQNNIALRYQMRLIGADQEELLKTNDSITEVNYLSNYFALDDGTPEGGIALRTGQYYQFAYEFELQVPDTITAIYVYWSRSGYNVNNTRFNIKIWKKIPGVNAPDTESEEVYVRRQAAIVYGEEFGKFSKIELPPTRIEAGLFYIGWEQTVTTKPIKIGADFSKDSREKFYQYMGTNRRWLNPPADDFYGTPMIRPKFGYGVALGMDDDIPVGIEDKEVVSKSVFEIEVYPNPADREVRVEGGVKTLRLYDLTGVLVFEKEYDKLQSKVMFSTSDYNSGLYILEVSNGAFSQSKKLTILHQ